MADSTWTSEDLQKTLVNPYYCLSEPPVISEAQWIKASAQIIAEVGPENFLRALLDVLKAH